MIGGGFMAYLTYEGLNYYHDHMKQFMSQAIQAAIRDVAGLEYQIVEQLPATGENGIIYLVPKSSGGSSDDSPGGTAIVGTATVGTAIVGDGGSGSGTAIVGTASVGTAVVGNGGSGSGSGNSGSNSGSSGNSNAIVGTATVGTATVGNGSSGSNLPIVGQAIVGSAVIGGTDDSSSDDDTGDDDNIYYEYIYVNDRFEKIGSTDVDLSGYLKESDIASDSSVNTMLTQVFG